MFTRRGFLFVAGGALASTAAGGMLGACGAAPSPASSAGGQAPTVRPLAPQASYPSPGAIATPAESAGALACPGEPPGAMPAGGSPRPAPAYPLRTSADRRYLVDQAGTPCFMQGDSGWECIVSLTREEADLYLEDRRVKGFNSIMVELIEHLFTADPPKNRYGDAPFTTPGDFTTPNEAYFAHADWVIRRAGEKGIQVLVVPCYLGYPGLSSMFPGYEGKPEGWYAKVLANGPDKCREYGRYLGRRYAGFDNIIWVMGGDRNPDDALPHVRALALGIKEADRRHLFTAHVLRESSPVDVYAGESWLDLNATYSYDDVHAALLTDYEREPVWPFFLIESIYEGEHDSTEVQIRRQAYWAFLCGATGQFFGNNPGWLFAPGWQAALDLPGSPSMSHLRSLVDRLPWWDLVPDIEHRVVTMGLGITAGRAYQVASARTADGRLAVAYMPTPRTITVDLSQVACARARATWFDPITGVDQPAGEFPTGGPRDFAPPAKQDWVLILEST